MTNCVSDLEHLIRLARVNRWPMRIGASAAAIELPGGAVLAIVLRITPPHSWHLLATVDLPTLNARDAYDLASAFAGLTASRVTWPLHVACGAAPHVVEEEVA